MNNSFVRYNSLFFAFLLPSLAAIVLLALFTEPVTGDLTRLGGYLEEDFGWRTPQQGFEQSSFKLSDTLADYDRYYDVVVLGDSFSEDEKKGWQNTFYQRTGLSIITLSMAKLATEAFSTSGLNVESIVNSKEFQEHPPRYFIFESVERDSFTRFHNYAQKAWASGYQTALPVSAEPLKFSGSITLPTLELTRYASAGAEQKIQQSVNYLVKAMRRWAGKSDKTRLFELTRSDLFSSGWPDHLLVVKQDTEKDLSGDAVAEAIRGLRAVQGLVEKNGKTRFMLLIFPDKLTVYTPYLKHREQAVSSYLPALSAHYSFPRLDKPMQIELQNGVKDLYLPDDTHAGYLGHRIAAEQLIDFYLKGNDSVVQ